MNKLLLDAGERVLSTAAQAGITAAIVETQDLSYWWAPLVLTSLTIGKTALASWVGRRDTAALLPLAADPAGRP